MRLPSASVVGSRENPLVARHVSPSVGWCRLRVTICSPVDEQLRGRAHRRTGGVEASLRATTADLIWSTLSASRSKFDLFGQPQAHRAVGRHFSNVLQAFYLEMSSVKFMLLELSEQKAPQGPRASIGCGCAQGVAVR
jgi:hypothetical protein